ncbi:MAG: hypothetical protein HOP19_15300 [Acidobacteria bacterium]|nr:hypothetical protein [Acidobacteriota bacterium]
MNISGNISGKNSGLNVFLIPLLTVLALYFPLASSLQSPATNAPAPAAAASPTPTPEPISGANLIVSGNVARQLCRFFGLPDQCDLRPRAGSIASEYDIEFMIVALPDPRDSRFNYLFDRNLDAIQRAVETAGYVLDRFDFPWQERGDDKVTDNKTDAAKTPRYLREPGVVLFRDSDNRADETNAAHSGKNKLLALLLVGETPTAGVNQTTLTSALEQVAQLSGWRGKANATAALRAVRLMAPLFSGSQDSLEIALQNWLASFATSPPHFDIISGSAMAVDGNKFRRHVRDPLRQRGVNQPDFYSTVIPSHFATEALIHYLELNDAEAADKIALLTEGNTTFGQAVRENRKQDVNDKSVQSDKVLKLPFPLHISQLRNASEKARSNQTGAPFEMRDIRRPLLPLLMEDTRETKDVVPLFSQLETASAELVLSNLLTEINRERIRYVGIVASDVKDILFLVSEIRRHCPNTVPFTFVADLLYLRPEINPDLRGTLIATTYPLFVQNQLWTTPFPGQPGVAVKNDRIQFPSHISQGAYNATLALLDKPGLMREYGSPFDIHFDNQTAKRKPALWISIVGTNNLWPLRVMEYRGDYAFAAPAAAAARPQQLSINLRGGFDSKLTMSVLLLLMLSSSLISLVVLAELIRAKGEEREWPHKLPHFFQRLISLVDRSWFGEVFGDPAFKHTYKLERRVYLFVACYCLLAMCMLILWVAVLPSWVAQESWLHAMLPARLDNPAMLPVKWEFSNRWMRVVFTLLPAIAYVPTIWLWGSICDWTAWRIRHAQAPDAPPDALNAQAAPRRPLRISHKFGVTIGVITTLLSLTAGYAYLLIREPYEHLFFFLRAGDFTSGISPLVPLLLVGMATFLWAFCELRRLMLLERLYNPDKERPQETAQKETTQAPPHYLNFEHESTRSFAGLSALEENLANLFRRSILGLPAAPLVMAGLLIPCGYLWLRVIPSIEGPTFDRLFGLFFVVVSLLMSLNFLRFVYVWIVLRRLLRRLAHHPLFAHPLSEGVKERFAGLPKLNITAPAPNHAPLSFSIQQAGRLYQTLKDPAPEFTASLFAAESNLQCALKSKAQGHWRAALADRCAAQSEMAEVSKLVAQMLEPRWRLLHSPPVATEAAPSEKEPPDWVREAELYLASCVASFLHQALAHLQNLALFVTPGMILLLMAITSYPFQPRELFLLFGWMLIVTIVAVTLFIFTQMSRDKVLSELSGTAPDQVNWNRDFLYRLTLHGLLPILALLGAQFPEVFRQLFTWLSALQGGGR